MDSVSRLALSFSNTLSLGRRKKKSTSPTTRPDSNTAKWAKSGEGGAGGSGQRTVVIDYRKDVRDGNVYFQVEGAIAGGRAEWVDARVAIAMWPRAVLDYYMSGLVFGGPEEEEAPDDDGGGWWRSTEAVRGLREAASEESELQLIQKLLQVGQSRSGRGLSPSGVNGLIRYVHSEHVLVFVEYRGDDDAAGGGYEEALLPLHVCVKECSGQLLDFLHTSIHLGGDDEE